jgi:ABC-type glutathione transport system ATPase component
MATMTEAGAPPEAACRPVSARPAADRGRPVVELAGVGKVFERGRSAVTVLDGVDLRVHAGEFVCLVGGSGCGKTTLLNLIAGLETASSGVVRICAPRPAVMFGPQRRTGPAPGRRAGPAPAPCRGGVVA